MGVDMEGFRRDKAAKLNMSLAEIAWLVSVAVLVPSNVGSNRVVGKSLQMEPTLSE